jgi:hypothetical protein
LQQHIEQQQQLGNQDAFVRAQHGQAPKQQQQGVGDAATASSRRSSSKRSSSKRSSNGARPASSSNGTAASHANGNGKQPAAASNGKAGHSSQAANDIVPLTSSKAPAGERSSSSKVQQQATQ